MSNDINWQKEATGILNAARVKRGLTYEEMCQRLATLGVHKTPSSLGLLINRGKFSFVFFLQCARILNIKKLHLDDYD